MAWLDDRIQTHPKIVGLSDRAFRHWIGALCYSSMHGTRGHIDMAVVVLHTTPKVRAELHNLVTACRDCNLKKYDNVWEPLPLEASYA